MNYTSTQNIILQQYQQHFIFQKYTQNIKLH